MEYLGSGARRALRGVRELSARERRRVREGVAEVRGLMVLLMKPRNRQRWTVEDKALLRQHLKHISRLSPYLAVLVLPGGFFMLPLLAWWLDRRRNGSRTST